MKNNYTYNYFDVDEIKRAERNSVLKPILENIDGDFVIMAISLLLGITLATFAFFADLQEMKENNTEEVITYEQQYEDIG